MIQTRLEVYRQHIAENDLSKETRICGGLVIASRRLWETIVEVSTQTAVVGERGQRRTKELVFEVHGQHQHQQHPSFEHRDRTALDTEEQPCGIPWRQRECQEQVHRPKHQRGLWEQRKCNAAMVLNVLSDLHKRSDA